MMHKNKCARCKHKFTHHLPECEIQGCSCPHYVGKNGNPLTVEHESTPKTFEQAEKSSLYKSNINPCIRWDDKRKRWVCKVCKKSGLWISMGNHVHMDFIAKYYGVKVIQK